MYKKVLLLLAGSGLLTLWLFAGLAKSQPTNTSSDAEKEVFLVLSPQYSSEDNIKKAKDLLFSKDFTVFRQLSPILPLEVNSRHNVCQSVFWLIKYKNGRITPEALKDLKVISAKIADIVKDDQEYIPNPNSGWMTGGSGLAQDTNSGIDPKEFTQFKQAELFIKRLDFQAKLETIKVAVLDTGISAHPSLKSSGILDGFNYTLPLDQNKNPDATRWNEKDFVDRYNASSNDPSTVVGHGTGIASVIAGSSPTDQYSGIAAGVQILPIKVCDDMGNCDAFQVTAGICRAIKENAKVINLSLSGEKPCIAVEAALKLAVEKGITVVTSAGNYESEIGRQIKPKPRFPIDYGVAGNDRNDLVPRGIIGVGAIDGSGTEFAPFSRRTYGMKVMAPGTDVSVASVSKDKPFAKVSGTSYAAAWVSGLVALLKAQDKLLGRTHTPAEIALIIQNSTTKLPCSRRNKNDCGSGLINFAKALGVN
jgi:subtilisin family serine protease